MVNEEKQKRKNNDELVIDNFLHAKVSVHTLSGSWMKNFLAFSIFFVILFYLVTEGKPVDINALSTLKSAALGLLSVASTVLFLAFLFCVYTKYIFLGLILRLTSQDVVSTLLIELVEERLRYNYLRGVQYKKVNNLLDDIHSELERITNKLDRYDKNSIDQIKEDIYGIKCLFSRDGAISNLIFLCSIDSFLEIKDDLIDISKKIKKEDYAALRFTPKKLKEKIDDLDEYRKKVPQETKIHPVKHWLSTIWTKLAFYLGDKELVIRIASLIKAYEQLALTLISLVSLLFLSALVLLGHGEWDTLDFWIGFLYKGLIPTTLVILTYKIFMFILTNLTSFSDDYDY
ncbi:MAG: hypothetical protein U9Q22_04650 [Candidatus Altiarchaeota archaeon]|nr:hypothetical protein [Candidatus Altiarchaeota archaeon]